MHALKVPLTCHKPIHGYSCATYVHTYMRVCVYIKSICKELVAVHAVSAAAAALVANPWYEFRSGVFSCV